LKLLRNPAQSPLPRGFTFYVAHPISLHSSFSLDPMRVAVRSIDWLGVAISFIDVAARKDGIDE
jgi:hypothetical protein